LPYYGGPDRLALGPQPPNFQQDALIFSYNHGTPVSQRLPGTASSRACAASRPGGAPLRPTWPPGSRRWLRFRWTSRL
jgi:hypothetical protein